MRAGLILMSGSVSGDVALGVRAERAGFDGVYTIEFFNRHGYVPLAAIAAKTSRIRIGTAIANAFTCPPPHLSLPPAWPSPRPRSRSR